MLPVTTSANHFSVITHFSFYYQVAVILRCLKWDGGKYGIGTEKKKSCNLFADYPPCADRQENLIIF